MASAAVDKPGIYMYCQSMLAVCMECPPAYQYTYKHPWIIQGWPIATRQTPLSKYPCMPKSPWTSLDYPRMTHCQQADPVFLYAKVTLDLPGLSKDDPLPAGRPLCQSIHLCQSYLRPPWIIKG